MLANHLKNYAVILASGSPRRHELLGGLDIPFAIKLKSIEEHYPANLKGEAITNFLARLKAEAFAPISSNELIITADTIVWMDNNALGKPRTKKEAREMLEMLSGKKHEVISSVCITTKAKKSCISDTTVVYFKELTKDEIRFYVEKYHPLDKAGAYGIQEWIGFTGVEKIEGSYFNVMGLPVHKLYEELLKY